MSDERFTIFNLEEWLDEQAENAELKGNTEDAIKFKAAAVAVNSIINKIISRIQEEEIEDKLTELTPHLCSECGEPMDDDGKKEIKH